MKVAVLQSNYLPWKGYFHIIQKADLFVFYDDVQYTHLDWRNRNRIKTSSGVKWMTVPCGSSERRMVCETQPVGEEWRIKHWRKLEENYRRAKYFDRYAGWFYQFYHETWDNLSDMNQFLIKHIAEEWLGLSTRFDDSRNYNLWGWKKARLLELLKQVGGEVYLSGPSARNYMNESDTEPLGIKLEWMSYDYPEYPQLYPPFVHGVSIVDLLFNTGPDAAKYIWGDR